MNKIRILLFGILIIIASSLIGQEEKNENLLITDNWGKEVFTFPISFAKSLPYIGVEEAYFPKSWGRKDSSTFWTYAFVWDINQTNKLTENELEDQLKIYFDGLLTGVNREKDKKIRKTSALLKRREETTNSNSFVGKIRIYDAFRTLKPLTLNVLVDQFLCAKEKSSVVVFKFSPQEFNHDVWRILHNIQPKNNPCTL